jgi:hypothetical protein
MIINIPIFGRELLDKISIHSIKSQYTNNFYIKQKLQDLIKIATKTLRVFSQNYLKKVY